MEYMLMAYVQEDGWNKMNRAEQEQGMPARMAFTRRSPQGEPHVADGPRIAILRLEEAPVLEMAYLA